MTKTLFTVLVNVHCAAMTQLASEQWNPYQSVQALKAYLPI